LICAFCEQWNPDGALRCCFCNNLLEGTEDTTLDGTPGYAKKVAVTTPHPAQQRYDPRATPEGLFEIARQMNAKELIALAAAAVGAIVLLVYFLRC
jgi:hypothetical protein